MDFIIYRKDILDKLGLERPETIAQLYDVLVAVKAAYPDMIPHRPQEPSWARRQQLGAFSHHHQRLRHLQRMAGRGRRASAHD